MPIETHEKIFTVSQLNRQTKVLLENTFTRISIEGEISNLAKPSSGHWYFTLKDERAQVRCAMFKSRNQTLKFPVENGKKYILRAQVTLYENRGDYQLIVDNMKIAGVGDLHLQFEALKQKLLEQGLFEDSAKKTLPSYPEKIGIITSASGAALQDILYVLKQRFNAIDIIILPVAVQGHGAAQDVITAIQKANEKNLAEVLIIGRGGGSIEDLWAFNDEALAKAIYASNIPIISAVGHETDFTIADFVADIRAPTPSAAAAYAVPDTAEVLHLLREKKRYLHKLTLSNLHTFRHRLNRARTKIHNPSQSLQLFFQRLDSIELRLKTVFTQEIKQLKTHLQHINKSLQHHSPEQRLHYFRRNLQQLKKRLYRQKIVTIKHHQDTFQHLASRLNSVSPLKTLARGYTISSKQGQVITSIKTLAVDDPLDIRFEDGQAKCRIENITEEKNA